jgi:hypothetical protein
MQLGRPVMNDPWGELSRLSFDELCPAVPAIAH